MVSYPPRQRQQGHANISVGKGHSAPFNTAEAVAHNKTIALTELLHKAANIGKIVAHIAVAHDDIFPLRRLYAADKCAAITLFSHVHHPCTMLTGNESGTVAAAVIRHKYLGGDIACRYTLFRLINAAADGLFLVQAGHKYSKFRHRFTFCLTFLVGLLSRMQSHTNAQSAITVAACAL